MILRAFSGLRLAVTILVALSTIAASAPYQNDAGSGVDGSDVASAPTPIGDYGTYVGTSRSNNDADWFAVTNTTTAATPAVCTTLVASGDTYENVTLGIVTPAGQRSITATLPTNSTLQLALAGQPTSTRVGLVPVPNPAGNQPARPGSYQFTVQGLTAADLGRGDAGQGNGVDAGSALAGALPLQGACTRGSLMPVGGLGDTIDTYTFALAEAGQVVYSLGGASGITLTLYDAAGNAIPGSQITTSGLGSLTLPAGSYSMSAAAPSGATGTLDYVIGMVGGPPGPCRPMCATT